MQALTKADSYTDLDSGLDLKPLLLAKQAKSFELVSGRLQTVMWVELKAVTDARCSHSKRFHDFLLIAISVKAHMLEELSGPSRWMSNSQRVHCNLKGWMPVEMFGRAYWELMSYYHPAFSSARFYAGVSWKMWWQRRKSSVWTAGQH